MEGKRFEPDNKNVIDVTQTKLNEDINKLAAHTIHQFHQISMNSKEIVDRSSSSMGFMFNDSMLFMQFVEFMIMQYKATMADAYQKVRK